VRILGWLNDAQAANVETTMLKRMAGSSATIGAIAPLRTGVCDAH
jgi:hypothetical protein